MMEQIIICPYCLREIPLTEAITRSIHEEIEKKFEKALVEKQGELSRKEEFSKEKYMISELICS